MDIIKQIDNVIKNHLINNGELYYILISIENWNELRRILIINTHLGYSSVINNYTINHKGVNIIYSPALDNETFLSI